MIRLFTLIWLTPLYLFLRCVDSVVRSSQVGTSGPQAPLLEPDHFPSRFLKWHRHLNSSARRLTKRSTLDSTSTLTALQALRGNELCLPALQRSPSAREGSGLVGRR